MSQNFTIQYIESDFAKESRPQIGDQITIAYEARLATGGAMDGQVIENEANFNFILGNGKAPKCLDLAVKEMSLDSSAIVTCT